MFQARKGARAAVAADSAPDTGCHLYVTRLITTCDQGRINFVQ